MKTFLAVCSCIATLSLPAPAAAEPRPLWLTPPVDGPVVARFDAPVRRWSAGHRGIDFAVPHGTAVRAAAEGRVVFAGAVAGSLAVTIDHGGFHTTYSALSDVDVRAGDDVDRGHWIGSSGAAHPGEAAGLHLGVKLGDRYLDPGSFLGPVDASAAIYLVPVVEPLDGIPELLKPYSQDVTYAPDCAGDRAVETGTGPPNDNVVVVVNGLGSRSEHPADTHLYRHAVDLLGYPEGRVYSFSYAGSSAPRLHEPYGPADTFDDLAASAGKLRTLLEEVGVRHPGADVDLLAHSQGGLVARVFLERLAEAWSPRLPRVEHLVTFATPHTGAPAADIARRMDESFAGRAVNGVLSRVARSTGLFPDPRAEAVAQLAPSSSLHRSLAEEDVAFGTRVLSLAVPDDFVVPAHRARLANEENLTLPPAGGFAHTQIVESDRAASVAYDFLRDAAPACPGGWDSWGPRAGRLIELVEDLVP